MNNKKNPSNEKLILSLGGDPRTDVLVLMSQEQIEEARSRVFLTEKARKKAALRVVESKSITEVTQELAYTQARLASGLNTPGSTVAMTWFAFLGPNQMLAFPGASPQYEVAMVSREQFVQLLARDADSPIIPTQTVPIPGIFPALASLSYGINDQVVTRRAIYTRNTVLLPQALNDNGQYNYSLRIQAPQTLRVDLSAGPTVDTGIVPFTMVRGVTYEIIASLFARSTVNGQLEPLIQVSDNVSPTVYTHVAPATTQVSTRGSFIKDQIATEVDDD